MASPTRAHTADLSQRSLAELRALLDDAFEGEFTDEDWEHALGGVHVLVHEDGSLIGHAAVVERRLVHRGAGIRTGYVEGVAVRADRRDRGHGGALMSVAEEIVRAAYDLGALSAGERARRLYERHGWRQWAGETWVLAPDGPRRTATDDGDVLVLTTPTSPELDLSDALACDWRSGDVW